METAFNIEHAENLSNSIKKTHEILKTDWSSVRSQWGELKSIWDDNQFDKFEQLIESLDATYQIVENGCEKHAQQIDEQIRIAQALNQKLNRLSK